jgi:hypothetical protein
MSEGKNEKIGIAIRSVIPPLADRELKQDLWPAMVRRLEERPAHLPWLDWALLGLLAAWLLFFPEAIPLLLYHL